jgi:hypothetical protein
MACAEPHRIAGERPWGLGHVQRGRPERPPAPAANAFPWVVGFIFRRLSRLRRDLTSYREEWSRPRGGIGVEAGTLLFGEEQIPHINFRPHCHRVARRACRRASGDIGPPDYSLFYSSLTMLY